MKKIGSVFLLSLLIASSLLGCNTNESENQNSQAQTYSNNRSKVNGLLGIGNNSHPNGTYDEDGYLGYTWSNPNLGIARSDVNYGVLSHQMAVAAGRVPGVEDAAVSINGGTAHVAIDVDRARGRNPEQVRQQVQQVLSRMMPRYDIEVKVHQGRGTMLRSRYLGGDDPDRFRNEYRKEVDTFRYEMRSNFRRNDMINGEK